MIEMKVAGIAIDAAAPIVLLKDVQIGVRCRFILIKIKQSNYRGTGKQKPPTNP